MSSTDLELLARYARQHGEDAFAELVRRHLGLVHSAALRQVRSPQLAEEVSQSVFLDLARNAGRLKPDTILSAWLYQVTRRTAIDVVRREASRQWREHIATEMNAPNAAAPDWLNIAPLLDEAMHALDDTDRAAVLLRYFENKSLREVGATLGTSENAAQKRLTRAVERLREFFAKRGVTVGSGGLAVLLSANAVLVAPVGLGATIIAGALSAAPILTTTFSAATNSVAMTTLQKTLIAAALVVAVTVGIHQAHRASTLQQQVRSLQEQQTVLAEQLAAERDEALRPLAARKPAVERGRDTNMTELLRLRGEVARLRREALELAGSNANSVPSSSRPLVISGILVSNLEPRHVSEGQVRAHIQTKIGDAYRPLAIDQDVRSVYASGLFSNVRVLTDNNQFGVTLTFVVQEKREVPSEAFSNQGAFTPETAFQTSLWAARRGDSNSLSQMLRWRREREDVVSDELANRITASQARSAMKTFSNLAAIRFLGEKAETKDATRMKVEFSENDGRKHLGEIYMLREGDEWRPALTFSRREGSTTVSSQFLLPTTPEVGPAN